MKREETMLCLLTISEAAAQVLIWYKRVEGPLSPETLQKVMLDKPINSEYWLYYHCISNAIDAGELPAVIKPRGKVEDRKLLTGAGIPEAFQALLPREDRWVTHSNLLAFIQRPDEMPNETYAHARAALARAAWLLANKAEVGGDSQKLYEQLAQMASDLNEDGKPPKLADTTLKGCAKEIIAAGETMRNAP